MNFKLILFISAIASCTISMRPSFQDTVVVKANQSEPRAYLSFSETENAVVPESEIDPTCRKLIIKNLQPFPDGSFPVKLLLPFGSYTLSKDPLLEIPAGIQVKIEDQLTGQVFDLNTSNDFNFKINRNIPERFVIHIDLPRSE